MRAFTNGREPDDIELVLTAMAQEVRPSDRPSRTPGEPFTFDWPDEDIENLALDIGQRMLVKHPQAAELLAAVARRAGYQKADQIWDLIRRAGREDLWSEAYQSNRSTSRKFSAFMIDFHGGWKRFLSLLVRLGEPREVALQQRRRLDELADYLETLDFRSQVPADTLGALEHETRIPWLLRTVAMLGGFDLDLLASEAQLALDLEEESGDSMGFLFDSASAVELERWDRIEDVPETEEALVELVGSTRWVCFLAITALEHTINPDKTSALLVAKLDSYPHYQRLHAAWLANELHPSASRARLSSEWKTESDPILRRVAAMVMATTCLPTEINWALMDSDSAVREAAIEQIGKRHDVRAFHEGLRELADGRAVGWMCLQCGTQNEAETARGCAKCRTSGPDPVRAARTLLDASGPTVG